MDGWVGVMEGWLAGYVDWGMGGRRERIPIDKGTVEEDKRTSQQNKWVHGGQKAGASRGSEIPEMQLPDRTGYTLLLQSTSWLLGEVWLPHGVGTKTRQVMELTHSLHLLSSAPVATTAYPHQQISTVNELPSRGQLPTHSCCLSRFVTRTW